jgi:NitT/TauT family transport system permease protein
VSAAAEGSVPTRPKEASRRLSIILQRIVLTLAFLLLWQLASSSVPGYLFPGPLATWDALLRIVKDGSIAVHLGVTMYRVTVGFFIATTVGVPLGIVLGSSKRLGEFFSPVLPVMNSVSSAIWSLIAVVWFGLSDMTPIFVCLMTGLPLIVTNVWQGTQNVNAEWLELARSVRMPKYKIFWKIYLPAVLPFFFSGARLAFGFGSRVSLVAEALGSSAGVGYMIVRSADLLQMSNVFAWSILLVGTIAAIDSLVIRPLEAFLFRWRRDSRA